MIITSLLLKFIDPSDICQLPCEMFVLPSANDNVNYLLMFK